MEGPVSLDDNDRLDTFYENPYYNSVGGVGCGYEKGEKLVGKEGVGYRTGMGSIAMEKSL